MTRRSPASAGLTPAGEAQSRQGIGRLGRAGVTGQTLLTTSPPETFIDAFRKRAVFDSGLGAVRPWLHGSATNLVARHRRVEARRFIALAWAVADPLTDDQENRIAARLAPSGCVNRWLTPWPGCVLVTGTCCCSFRSAISATTR